MYGSIQRPLIAHRYAATGPLNRRRLDAVSGKKRDAKHAQYRPDDASPYGLRSRPRAARQHQTRINATRAPWGRIG